MNALSNSFYDITANGWDIVASPRHADVVTVSGPMTDAMRSAARETVEERRYQNRRRNRRLRRKRRSVERRAGKRQGRDRRVASASDCPRLPAESRSDQNWAA